VTKPASGQRAYLRPHRCRHRGCAVGTKRNWRAQGNIRLVPFRNRRPCRGSLHGGNDLSRMGASSCIRGAEPSRDVLSAGHGAHLRRSAGPDAPWPRSMAAAARCRLSRAAGSGLMPLASSTTPGGRPGYRPRISASSPKPDICALMSARPSAALTRSAPRRPLRGLALVLGTTSGTTKAGVH